MPAWKYFVLFPHGKLTFVFWASAPTHTPARITVFGAQWCILSSAEAGNERSGVVWCGVARTSNTWEMWLWSHLIAIKLRMAEQVMPFFHCLPFVLPPALVVFALCPFSGRGSFFMTSGALTANVSKLCKCAKPHLGGLVEGSHYHKLLLFLYV